VIDRASIVTNTVIHVIRVHGGIDAAVRREITAILRAEFHDVAQETLQEIRRIDE
jgi:hypothetical protein